MPEVFESVEALRASVEQLNWVHQIDLGNGIVTPGRWPPHPLILKAFETIDFRGKRVLDIGCWDGLWSFEAERRGAAQVVAIDDISQRSYTEQPTFRLAHQALRSSVEYHPDLSVFDLPTRLPEQFFDVILFCGVYYHLKDPLLALARIRRMAADHAVLVIEGDVIDDVKRSFATFSYRSHHLNDPSNWWVPSIACLREWVECSFFEILHEFSSVDRSTDGPLTDLKRRIKRFLDRDSHRIGRHVLTGKAVCRVDPNYVFADRDLAAFDLNRY